ncbi:MAG: HEAT repeat domain-containing protein [Balneolaceae bacterium]|nr:HEAT repeat domain-containing protein [Balneolaceae bacterium]
MRLSHGDPSVRFWAATAFSIANEQRDDIENELLSHTNDPSPAVRIAVAEALYRYGNHDTAIEVLSAGLDEEHPFAKLRALNTIEALNIENMGDELADKIATVRESHDEEWGTDYYIRRAATAILE